jgi:hypothetical protein
MPPFIQTFTTFRDYVDILGSNAPQALVLDCWRRLDLALLDYFQSLGEKQPLTRHAQENQIADDPQLGPEIVSVLSLLRRTRNKVAHEQPTLATPQAVWFAETTLRLIGRLALAPSTRLS